MFEEASERRKMTARARRFHFIYAALLLMFAMATCLILGRASADSPEGRRLPGVKPPAASEHDRAMRSAMGINLAAGRDLLTTYSGETAITQLLEQNLTQPLALTSADFDEDGVPDLLSGYAGAGKGILTLHRGNVNLLFPNNPQSKSHNDEATITVSDEGTIDRSVPAYFLAAARVFDLPEPADFLGAGDFDADGHWDVVAAARGSNKLYWLSGDGQGGFKEAKAIELRGSVTALLTGEVNRADGLTDIVLATTGQEGANVLVFESPEGALKGKPEVFAMPAAANGLTLGQMDEDVYADLAVAAGNQLVIVHGRDRKLSLDQIRQREVQPAVLSQRSFPVAIDSIAIGDFTGGHQSELALLTADGTVQVLGGDGTRNRRQAELSAARLISSVSVSESAHLLLKARLSSEPRDNLILVDAVNHQLRMVVTADDQRQTAGKRANARMITGNLQQAMLDVEGEPVAVLPMRLNEDALSDLIILRKGTSTPTVALTAAAMTFTVTNTNDSGAGSLRQAILDANANPGADTIRFSIASGEQTITPGSALPVVTDALTIDGTSQPGFTGKPIIEINGKKVQANGLSITAGNSVVRGLVINRFKGIFSNGSGLSLSVNGGNLIEGNFIGTDFTGTVDRGNENEGILCSVPDNRIGGTVAAARNIISGNDQAGIYLLGPTARGNVIQGNFIGVDVTGTTVLSNPFVGVFIDRAPNNTIGGTVAAARNVLTNPSPRGFGEGVIIDGLGASGNLIQGNFIGTDASGRVGLGNALGIEINTEASANTIGGTVAAARNIISKNESGIYLFGGTSETLIQGNFIGTDVTGTVALGNMFFGVITNANTLHNAIGGVIAGARNIISGNTGRGMTLNCRDSQVQGNFIGTDVTGTVALGNGNSGIELEDEGNLVGGLEDGARNIISANGKYGILVAEDRNQIQGNFIGTDVTGTAALGNGDSGIATFSANNVIGGTQTEARNLISANKIAGIMISSGAANNRLEGNLIGTDVSGTVNLGNAFYGIQMAGAGTGNRIGGTLPGAGNTIAFNGGPGVNSNISTGNAIRGNSIFSNGGLGIEHSGSGVNANDPCDSSLDNVQNFPVITAVMTTETGTLIEGTLNSKPNSQFAIDFFANHSCDFLGNGEGETFIGSITITTNSSCNASFSAVLPIAIASGQIITATATNSNNNTSEFSRCFPPSTVSGPKLSTVAIQGKNLIVTGDGFDNGAVILLNGEAQKTKKDEQDPEARLIGKKAGKKIAPGQTVSVQVRNSDGSLSNQIIFTRFP
jgi:FG-GAP-like repeat